MPKMGCGSWPHDSMRASHFHIRSGQKSGARIRDFSLQTSKLPLAIFLEMLSIYTCVCPAASTVSFHSVDQPMHLGSVGEKEGELENFV